mmetsp:Transcript_59533/g.192606  ORF Transcript_59533/g.192606 Transcript_59533/m.192606 type:complete len:184 (-) Transcript_59533:306-857(-)
MANCLPFQEGSALFLLAVKVNHACCANVRWDASSGSFYARRAIVAGDALGHAYLNVAQLSGFSTFGRCSALYQQFFFWCRCGSCEAERHWASEGPEDAARHAEMRVAEALLRTDVDGELARQLLALATRAGLAEQHFVAAEAASRAGLPRAGTAAPPREAHDAAWRRADVGCANDQIDLSSLD